MDGLIWENWAPLATAIVGLFVGALISEFHVALAGARERRRALNVLLFDLLQLRHDVRNSDPNLVFGTFLRVIQKKFGDVATQFFDMPQFRTTLVDIHKVLQDSDRPKLTERYENAVRGLVPHDPVLAYRLSGNAQISGVERAVALYYARVAAHPDVIKERDAPKLLSVLEDETATALIAEALKDLSADVRQVARARRWRLIRWAWTPLSVEKVLVRQDQRPASTIDQEIEGLLDRVLPGIVHALEQAAQTLEPSQPGPTCGCDGSS